MGGTAVFDTSWIVFQPQVLRLGLESVFSIGHSSCDLKQGCVLCGDGSRLPALGFTSNMLTVLCYSQPYSKLPWKTRGHNSKKVIIQLPEAYSFLLITPVMSPSARLCHRFTATSPAPSLFCRGWKDSVFQSVRLPAYLSVFLPSVIKNNTCVHSLFAFQGWLTLKKEKRGQIKLEYQRGWWSVRAWALRRTLDEMCD